MKRFSSLFIIGLFMLALGGCPPPDPNNPATKYQTAKLTITVARAVVKSGYATFLAVEANLRTNCNDKVCSKLHPDKASAKYKECMAQDHSAVPEWKTCYGKMAVAKPIVDKVVPLGLSLLDESDTAIGFAIQYELAKAAKEAAKDPKKLQQFCDSAFPTKTGEEYQKCIAGQPLQKADWQKLLKGGCCVVYNGFAFMPEEYKKYTDPIAIWFKGYGNCS